MGSTSSSAMPTVGRESWYTGLVYGISVFMTSLPPVSWTTTSTGGLPLPDMPLLLPVLRELVFAGRHDQLRHAYDPGRALPLVGLVAQL